MKYVFGAFLLAFVIINVRGIGQGIQDGTAYLVVSAAGDGLLGGADRDDRPLAFWFNISVNCLFVIAAFAGALWVAVFRAGF